MEKRLQKSNISPLDCKLQQSQQKYYTHTHTHRHKLCYKIQCPRTARAIQRNPVSKNQNKRTKKKKTKKQKSNVPS